MGVFLSGGIESSAIVSAAATAGASALRTYTVRFDQPASEHQYAQLVASRFGTVHHELRVDGSTVAADLPRILDHLDQPTIDAVNAFFVSRAVAATGIKAVLSGTGADEMFGGYPSFTRLPAATRLKRRLGPVFPAVAPPVGLMLPRRLAARWREFAAANGRVESAYRVQRSLFMPAEIEKLGGPALRDVERRAIDKLASAESTLLEGGPASTLEGGVARLETRVYLQSQLLRDLDAMSMAHSLEVRVPFVDHVLLEAVWPALGARPALMRNKRLLRTTLVRPLPAAAVDRPKQGFTLPFAHWMRGELEPFVRDGMDYLVKAGWLASGAPDDVWGAWRSGVSHWSRVWALGVLGAFLQRTQDAAC